MDFFDIQYIIGQYDSTCDEIARVVNHQLFEGGRSWSWIADEVGGLCDFDENDIISTTDMILILKSKMTYEQYAEWRNANFHNEKYINLRSWLMGARHELFEKNKSNTP